MVDNIELDLYLPPCLVPRLPSVKSSVSLSIYADKAVWLSGWVSLNELRGSSGNPVSATKSSEGDNLAASSCSSGISGVGNRNASISGLRRGDFLCTRMVGIS